MIVIIDYDIGNIAAVANMLSRIGVKAKITANEADVESASHIILPGNGSFDACVKTLRATGIVPLLERKVLECKTPLLGICVGAQMLGNSSEEGKEDGLGWIDMEVKRFQTSNGLRVPQMGWNTIESEMEGHYLLNGLVPDSKFYFVHSYYMAPKDDGNILMKTVYGSPFASAVIKENICGVQFHPEKSHRFGKQLLTNFVKGKV